MTPAARLQAAIEILDQVLEGMAAEQALTGWARRSRFAGSKDRAAVRDHVFDALRNRNSFADLGGSLTGRGLILGAVRAGEVDPDTLFTGIGHAPAELTAQERDQVAIGGQVDLPDWLWPVFQDSLGDQAEAVEHALRLRAPVFLRANLRKTTRDKAQERLAAEGIETEPHDGAATALQVLSGDRKIRQSKAFQTGLIELQDAASQSIAERLDLRDGIKVLDFCAGGGGKSLALAALAKVQIHAHDVSPQRMRDIPDRAARAGVRIDQVAGKTLKDKAPYDLVLCDAPCSGSGSWRRAPDAKWRFTQERLDQLVDIQSEILTQVRDLVGPGGILAYATCSVLRAENHDRVAAFLAENPDWQLLDQKQWALEDGSDGFFLARLQRRQD